MLNQPHQSLCSLVLERAQDADQTGCEKKERDLRWHRVVHATRRSPMRQHSSLRAHFFTDKDSDCHCLPEGIFASPETAHDALVNWRNSSFKFCHCLHTIMSFQTHMLLFFSVGFKSRSFFKKLLSYSDSSKSPGAVKLQTGPKNTIKVVHRTHALYSKTSKAVFWVCVRNRTKCMSFSLIILMPGSIYVPKLYVRLDTWSWVIYKKTVTSCWSIPSMWLPTCTNSQNR